MLTKELGTLLAEVAWTQFRKMPSSNPGDYAAAIARSLDSFTVLTPEGREKERDAVEAIAAHAETAADLAYDWPESAKMFARQTAERARLALLTDEVGDAD